MMLRITTCNLVATVSMSAWHWKRMAFIFVCFMCKYLKDIYFCYKKNGTKLFN